MLADTTSIAFVPGGRLNFKTLGRCRYFPSNLYDWLIGTAIDQQPSDVWSGVVPGWISCGLCIDSSGRVQSGIENTFLVFAQGAR
ncbi:hypothetical protein D9M70_587210 [compost metagenome]